MPRRRTLLCAGLAILFAGPAFSGFDDGLAAYDAGDYATARDLWISLAESGDARAQTALAGLYLGGYGVARDFRMAAIWFRRAAEQGDAIAQLNLGELYESGRGVSRDRVEAWRWYSYAARQGNDWARNRRDSIAAQFDDAARAAARARLNAGN